MKPRGERSKIAERECVIKHEAILAASAPPHFRTDFIEARSLDPHGLVDCQRAIEPDPGTLLRKAVEVPSISA